MKSIRRTNEKGITLIALVLTIIVLLIISGISISMLTGQNGILNISQVAYSYYEINKRNIPLELLSKLADYYNTSVDYLLYRTNDSKPYPKI